MRHRLHRDPLGGQVLEEAVDRARVALRGARAPEPAPLELLEHVVPEPLEQGIVLDGDTADGVLAHAWWNAQRAAPGPGPGTPRLVGGRVRDIRFVAVRPGPPAACGVCCSHLGLHLQGVRAVDRRRGGGFGDRNLLRRHPDERHEVVG